MFPPRHHRPAKWRETGAFTSGNYFNRKIDQRIEAKLKRKVQEAVGANLEEEIYQPGNSDTAYTGFPRARKGWKNSDKNMASYPATTPSQHLIKQRTIGAVI